MQITQCQLVRIKTHRHMNKQTDVHKYTDKHVNKHTGTETHKQTDIRTQTNREVLTDRQRETDRFAVITSSSPFNIPKYVSDQTQVICSQFRDLNLNTGRACTSSQYSSALAFILAALPRLQQRVIVLLIIIQRGAPHSYVLPSSPFFLHLFSSTS